MIINDSSDSLKIEIEKKNEGKTIKKYLVESYEFSSRLLRRLKKSNSILLNGKSVSVKKTVFRGDILEILFRDEKINYEAEDIDLDIVYEDGDLLILNKKPFMVVHPTKTHKNGTLANGIANYFKKNNIYKRIRFVNRLDMNTSGIIVIAKNSFAHQFVQKQMENNSIEKKYKALISNSFPYDEGRIELPIGKMEKGDIKRKVFKGGKESITEFNTIEFFNKGALIDIKLITGRTHQIRVHFNHYGNPLIGDDLYNDQKTDLIDRQGLHSYYLKLRVPRKKELIELEAKLPSDIKNAIKKLKGDKNAKL